MLPSDHRRAIAAIAAALLLGACASMQPQPPRDDALFARVAAGLTQEEVRRLVGPPDETMPFPLSRTLSWDYYYQDSWGYRVMFSVTFDENGRAVSKVARRVNDGGDHSN